MMRPVTSTAWLLVFLFCAVASGQRRPQAAEPTAVSVAAMAPLAGASYAGAERCQTCHRAEASEFNKTHHAAIKPPQKDSVTGCEMCQVPVRRTPMPRKPRKAMTRRQRQLPS